MKTQDELKRQLRQIDRKGYKAYKTLEGEYRFGSYLLCIDHVQGDPFATPSRVRLRYQNRIPEEYFESRHRKTAAEDYLLRRLHRNLRSGGKERRGSGKSGLITACRVGQEILERTAVLLSPETIEARLEIGFPAYGRTIAAGELEEILFVSLPEIARKTFSLDEGMKRELEETAALADDQQYIREALAKQGLAAFLADGSILPRESGVSQRPMKGAVPFRSPESAAVTLQLPHRGPTRGMGIRQGITVIVGGGYHGKSTLLKAVERGVYNHISGDGREYVITDETAFKLRAEEGRCIHQVDISLFISNLPSRADTEAFVTENASGSTSQAANTVEALACGSRVLLIDEDTSATNFMVRDDRMARLVEDRKEPITPFIRFIRSLYTDLGVSTILVAGSSGAYLSVADTVLQMDCYEAREVTKKAKELAEKVTEGKAERKRWVKKPISPRRIEKARVHGWDTVSFDKTEVDLRYLEQIVDETQTAALAYLIPWLLEKGADGKRTAVELALLAEEKIRKDGLLSMIPRNYGAGAPAAVRALEILACLQRYRMI